MYHVIKVISGPRRKCVQQGPEMRSAKGGDASGGRWTVGGDGYTAYFILKYQGID